MTEMTALRTYLPVLEDPTVLHSLKIRDYEALLMPVKVKYLYERLGLDRLLAILLDLERLGILPPASVLDLGCNTGLFSIALSLMGYRATGVDNNIASDVQGFYPAPSLSIAKSQKEYLNLGDLELVESDAEEFISSKPLSFDVCLLLSVVHQWRSGYAMANVGRKPDEVIDDILRKISLATRKVIYYEEGDSLVRFGRDGLSLPEWFLRLGLANDFKRIAVSPAANGDLRPLYRISKVPNKR